MGPCREVLQQMRIVMPAWPGRVRGGPRRDRSPARTWPLAAAVPG